MISQKSCTYKIAFLSTISILAIVLVVGLSYWQEIQKNREFESKISSRVVGSLIADQIAQGVKLGIPLEKLVGVPEYLKSNFKAIDHIAKISITNNSGEAIWTLKANRNLSLFNSISVPINVDKIKIAAVEVTLYDDKLSTLFSNSAITLGLLLLGILFISYFTFVHSWFSGQVLRNSAIYETISHILSGDFSKIYLAGKRRSFDLRLQMMSQGIKKVNESAVRLRRLTESLLRTEPDENHRLKLYKIMDAGEADNRFIGNSPAIIRYLPIIYQVRFVFLLTGISAAELVYVMPIGSVELSYLWRFIAVFLGLPLGACIAQHSRFSLATITIFAGSVLSIILFLLAFFYESMTLEIIVLILLLIGGKACGMILNNSKAALSIAQYSPNFKVYSKSDHYDWLYFLYGLIWIGPTSAVILLNIFPFTFAILIILIPSLSLIFLPLKWLSVRSVWQSVPANSKIVLTEKFFFKWKKLILDRNFFSVLLLGILLGVYWTKLSIDKVEVDSLILFSTFTGLGLLISFEKNIAFSYKILILMFSLFLLYFKNTFLFALGIGIYLNLARPVFSMFYKNEIIFLVNIILGLLIGFIAFTVMSYFSNLNIHNIYIVLLSAVYLFYSFTLEKE